MVGALDTESERWDGARQARAAQPPPCARNALDTGGHSHRWNEYSYVLNDPASAVDAEGLLTTFTPMSPWEEDDPARWFSTLEFGNLMPIVDPATPLPHPGPTGGGGQIHLLPGAPLPDTVQLAKSCAPLPTSVTRYAEAAAQVALLTAEFFTGLGAPSQTFGPQTAISQVMAQSAGVHDILQSYRTLGQTSGLYTFGLAGLKAAGDNPAAQLVGSFRWAVTPVGGGVNLVLSNTTSFRSLTYDHGAQWQRGNFHPDPFLSVPVPVGNIHQRFEIFVPCG